MLQVGRTVDARLRTEVVQEFPSVSFDWYDQRILLALERGGSVTGGSRARHRSFDGQPALDSALHLGGRALHVQWLRDLCPLHPELRVEVTGDTVIHRCCEI
jgi:hypothetical protein